MSGTLLIVSFSNISQDARVLKQIRLFSKRYRVVTCGEGPTPDGVTEHVELPSSTEGLPTSRAGRLLFGLVFSLLQLLRLFHMAYRMAPQIRSARRLLGSLEFDAVLCDDIQPLPLLSELISLKRVHADVHEYFPGLHDQDPRWNLLWQPYYRWMIRGFLTHAASMTTVTNAIARKYEQEFGIRECRVVMNAASYHELRATPVSTPIRIVHSGAAVANRRIENMMQAVADSLPKFTLDLYLLPSEPGYFAWLEQLANRLGERISVHEAVPQPELVRTLSNYDVGITVLAATNTNNVLALPNKFFDYIQARLGIITSPSEDMGRILAEEDLGIVTESAEQQAIRDSLARVDSDSVARWKRNAEQCAKEYSSERVSDEWVRAVDALMR